LETTYRIVLPSKEEKKAAAAGWAMWTTRWVKMERRGAFAVAGAPHRSFSSFQNRIRKEAVVGLPESVQLSAADACVNAFARKWNSFGPSHGRDRRRDPKYEVVVKDQNGVVLRNHYR